MSSATARHLSLTQVLVCGAAIVTLSMGVRHGFGLWLQPITQARGWTRETFALALAIQNLAWGVFGIFAGMAADRFGAFRVLVVGALLYAAGSSIPRKDFNRVVRAAASVGEAFSLQSPPCPKPTANFR